MKNDTKTTPRLEAIISILTEKPQKRLILEQKLSLHNHTTTRITLIRDLNQLINSGRIIKSGTGKSTEYSLTVLEILCHRRQHLLTPRNRAINQISSWSTRSLSSRNSNDPQPQICLRHYSSAPSQT